METNKEFKTWFRSFSNNGKGFYIFSKIERMMGMYWLNIWLNRKCIIIEIMIFQNKVGVFSLVQV